MIYLDLRCGSHRSRFETVSKAAKLIKALKKLCPSEIYLSTRAVGYSVHESRKDMFILQDPFSQIIH
jgi:hypothetical protein